MNLQWKASQFEQLSLNELYDILKLRVEVFVVEQNCPYPELDDKDRHPQTLHLIGTDDDGALLAYARILAPGLSYPDASIGRVLVREAARGCGLAHLLMQKAIEISRQNWPEHKIQIGAQAHLQDFYQQQGFNTISAMYLEDGIEHVDMLLSR